MSQWSTVRDKVDFDHGVRFVFRFFWDGASVGFEGEDRVGDALS